MENAGIPFSVIGLDLHARVNCYGLPPSPPARGGPGLLVSNTMGRTGEERIESGCPTSRSLRVRENQLHTLDVFHVNRSCPREKPQDWPDRLFAPQLSLSIANLCDPARSRGHSRKINSGNLQSISPNLLTLKSSRSSGKTPAERLLLFGCPTHVGCPIHVAALSLHGWETTFWVPLFGCPIH
jgi:hypothetical protein